jgi:hypothetical protein
MRSIRNYYKILVGKTRKGKILRFGRRWEDNIKIHPDEIGCGLDLSGLETSVGT